jgi:hypothetical protein
MMMMVVLMMICMMMMMIMMMMMMLMMMLLLLMMMLMMMLIMPMRLVVVRRQGASFLVEADDAGDGLRHRHTDRIQGLPCGGAVGHPQGNKHHIKIILIAVMLSVLLFIGLLDPARARISCLPSSQICPFSPSFDGSFSLSFGPYYSP